MARANQNVRMKAKKRAAAPRKRRAGNRAQREHSGIRDAKALTDAMAASRAIMHELKPGSNGPLTMPSNSQPRFRRLPRPRMSLRNAMRAQGLDEHKIARVFNRQVNRLQRPPKAKNKLPAPQEKLLLEAIKECVKIMEPAPRGNVAQDSSAIHLVHDIPRPPRRADTAGDAAVHNGAPTGWPASAQQ